jgi:hypothetical protein
MFENCKRVKSSEAISRLLRFPLERRLLRGKNRPSQRLCPDEAGQELVEGCSMIRSIRFDEKIKPSQVRKAERRMPAQYYPKKVDQI